MPRTDEPVSISNDRAIEKLRTLKRVYQAESIRLLKSVNVRTSERAMSLAHYKECELALTLAIEALQDKADGAND